MEVEEIIRKIPEYGEFLTVDELNESSEQLARNYPDTLKIFEIGRAWNGEPIKALKIGDGKYRAVLWGFPHPNEPVGSMTLEFFSRLLVEDDELRKELNFTWYIVKCADPYSARLNEGWFKDDFTVEKHALNFYRSPALKQIEWTFPIEYKTLRWDKPVPETQALMSLMEEAKPHFIYPLHDAGFGGVYFYVSDECPELYPKFHSLVESQELPLHLGEPETPFLKKLNDAIFKMFTVEDTYDYYEKYSDKDPATFLKHGTSSDHYAKTRFGSFCLVCEVPYLFDERIEDQSPSETMRRDLKIKEIEEEENRYEFIRAVFKKGEKHFDRESPFHEVFTEYLANIKPMMEAEKKWALEDESLNRKAKVSEVFDSTVSPKFYGLRTYGMLLRLIGDSLKKSREKALLECKDMVEKKFREEYEEFEKSSKYKVIPIMKLVSVQLGSAIYVCKYLKGTK